MARASREADGRQGSRPWPPRLVSLPPSKREAAPRRPGRTRTGQRHCRLSAGCCNAASGGSVGLRSCASRAAQPRGTRGKDALVPRRTAKPVRRVCRDPPAHPALVSASRGQFDHKFDAKGEGRGPRERCGDGQTDAWWRSVRELDVSQNGGDEQMQGAWH